MSATHGKAGRDSLYDARLALHPRPPRRDGCRRLPSFRRKSTSPNICLQDIALRHVSLRGTCTIHLLSSLMKLSPGMTEGLFRKLIDQQHIRSPAHGGRRLCFRPEPRRAAHGMERAATVAIPDRLRFRWPLIRPPFELRPRPSGSPAPCCAAHFPISWWAMSCWMRSAPH